MNSYDFVHLVLYAYEEPIEGRTKLQKLHYFVGCLSDFLPSNLGYRAYYYGPYSGEVAAAVNELQGFGFLQQRSISSGSVDSHGFEVSRYDYRLTPEGRQIAMEKADRYPEDWERIRGAVERLKSQASIDYVKLSFAAKMHFLLGEKDGPASFDELVQMAPKFGWKVTPDQMKDAGSFLEALELISIAKDGE